MTIVIFIFEIGLGEKWEGKGGFKAWSHNFLPIALKLLFWTVIWKGVITLHWSGNKEQNRPIAATVTWSRTLLQKSGDKDQRSGFGMQQGGRVRPVEPDNIADTLPLSAAVQHYRPAILSPPCQYFQLSARHCRPGRCRERIGRQAKGL